ncbi:MAG: response regulator [Bacteriovoracia bacterium]
MSIWIVDDEPEICHILDYLLKRDGHQTRSFENPLDALSEMTTAQPTAIICDFKMPQMNGLDFFIAIKDAWKGDFYILTGEPSTDPNELKALGIKDVLFKPRDLTQIVSILKYPSNS